MTEAEVSMKRIFVVGCPRSGTTILQRILAEGLDLFTLPETHFFERMVGNGNRRFFPNTFMQESITKRVRYRIRQRLGISTPRLWEGLDFIPDNFRGRHVSMKRLAATFLDGMDALAREQNCLGWLEKSPEHVQFVREILHYVPDAKIVHIIRDGRDVVASMRDAALKYGGHWEVLFPNIEYAIDRWNSDISASASQVNDPRNLFIRYNTFTQFQAPTLHYIAANMALDSTKVGKMKQNLTIANDKEKWKSEAVGGALQKASSKWLTALTDQERYVADNGLIQLPVNLENALKSFDTEISKYV